MDTESGSRHERGPDRRPKASRRAMAREIVLNQISQPG